LLRCTISGPARSPFSEKAKVQEKSKLPGLGLPECGAIARAECCNAGHCFALHRDYFDAEKLNRKKSLPRMTFQ
jgi:hypothetical protein